MFEHYISSKSPVEGNLAVVGVVVVAAVAPIMACEREMKLH